MKGLFKGSSALQLAMFLFLSLLFSFSSLFLIVYNVTLIKWPILFTKNRSSAILSVCV